MGKLLREYIDLKDLQIMCESESENSNKHWKLSGVFLQSGIINKNGRKYPRAILEREVKLYNEFYISKNRSLGELDHPDAPSINLERVSHVIESLKMENDDGIGVLRLIDTPMGKIAQTLVAEKILLGVSTRGVGSLDGDTVKEDYKLITPADIVLDPSAPRAFVESIRENKEWILSGEKWVCVDGKCEKVQTESVKQKDIVETAVEELVEKVDKKYDSKHALNYMLEFLDRINSKK